MTIALYLFDLNDRHVVSKVTRHLFSDLKSVTIDVSPDSGEAVKIAEVQAMWDDISAEPGFPVFELNLFDANNLDADQAPTESPRKSYAVTCFLEGHSDAQFDDDGRPVGEHLVELYEDDDFINDDNLTILVSPDGWWFPGEDIDPAWDPSEDESDTDS